MGVKFWVSDMKVRNGGMKLQQDEVTKDVSDKLCNAEKRSAWVRCS